MQVLRIIMAAWLTLCCWAVVKGDQRAMAAPPAGAAAPPPGAPLSLKQEGGLKPKDSFRECENCPDMVVVPAGAFTMGSPMDETDRADFEGPQHTVKIARPFAVGKFHVTRDQFATFVHETGYQTSSSCTTFKDGKVLQASWDNPGFVQEGSHPVVCVGWDDANAYVKWVANKTGKAYRLLSEAEFEYARRGQKTLGKYPRFWFGNDKKDTCRYANGHNTQCDDGFEFTSPVGHYPPNAFGLFDMAGNAGQWVADCWHDSYAGAPADGSAWTTACNLITTHLARGSSWTSSSTDMRDAARFPEAEAYSSKGFRVARTLSAQQR